MKLRDYLQEGKIQKKEITCKKCNNKFSGDAKAFQLKCPKCGTWNDTGSELYKNKGKKGFDKGFNPKKQAYYD